MTIEELARIAYETWVKETWRRDFPEDYDWAVQDEATIAAWVKIAAQVAARTGAYMLDGRAR